MCPDSARGSSPLAQPLRITFVLPFLSFTGGLRVVFEHARELRRRGHTVRLIAPAVRPGVPWTASGRAALRIWLLERWVHDYSRTLEYFGVSDCVTRVPALEDRYFPAGDVLIATSWQTAEPVAGAPERCGRGTYFLQHYEVFEPGLEEAVDATWRLPLQRIVISTWLADVAKERFGLSVWGPVMNGIRHEQFHPRGRRENDPPVIGMMYQLFPWKGIDDGLEAIRIAREQFPELRAHLFGHFRIRHSLRRGDIYERAPEQERIGQIYRECDLFLSPSWTEGWGLPAMEAMASGCAVVATEVGGIPDFSIPGETVLTAPPRQPQELAAQIVRLLGDRELRLRIARAGHDYVARFTWQAASGQLEDVLRRIDDGEQPPGQDGGG